ncbi:hypothetical protein KY319_04730, partial [Candidatus Woesearchaeota archaeon]|nr:hypothetical protein [Candidatus Woesearchaeota archaeon]
TEQAELFAKLQGGYEVNRLSVALKDGVADRALLGVQVGLALNRFRASTSFLYGNGPCSYRLLSGFNERGGFETFFVEGDASYLIWGNGEKKNYTSSGSFDQYYAGEDLEKSIYAMLQGFWRKDRMSRLQDSNAFGIEGALPIVFNGYDYSKDEQGNIHAKGFLIRMTPYTSYGESNSSSDLVARSTNTPGFANGIRFEVEHGRYVGTRLDGRYVFERVNTRDPVNGDSSKDGGKFELSLEFYLRF